ncbi:response regulator [endosymbiont 'TC1' of Trimyema compressum]|uniref:response regulator n=1 Tax=endosymbiont 'TC1' of Trimyema compressum TaxID=243899 RepID=UPI000A4C521B|nr:response regulator transcription factor [endosymbiont 'TC1' of Trimyema compressum]
MMVSKYLSKGLIPIASEIMIIDDDQIIVELLSMLIEKDSNFKVVASGKNANEALSHLKNYSLDLTLLDIRLGTDNGIELLRKIKEIDTKPKVVMLTTFDDDQNIITALKYGADGYLLKSSGSASITNALNVVLDNKVIIEKEVLASIREKLYVKKDFLNLTPKEDEVIKLLAEGLSNQEIADALYLNNGTVRNTVSQLLDKTAMRDRTQLLLL